jgi:cell wall-associated NlpC family hydrolase
MPRPTVRMKLLIVGLVVLGLLGAALVSVPLLMVMGQTASDSDSDSSSVTACGPVATTGGQTITLDDEQLSNARTVIQTGRSLNVPSRGLVVAIAVALQESQLQNLTWGDQDSVGIFQQRAGWGTYAARTDPATAAKMFYTGGGSGQPGLLQTPDWASMSITAAGQAVQRSAFPLAYAKWETLAGSLVRSVVGNDPLGCTDALAAGLPATSVGRMLAVALAQQGDPYIFGAVGPDAFDCSGLVIYSWRLAGYQLNVRTAAQMFDESTPVAAGSEQPGDLLFGEFDTRVPGAGPGFIVVKPGLAVQAPSTGRTVQLSHYTADGVNWRLGRLKPGSLIPLNKPTPVKAAA